MISSFRLKFGRTPDGVATDIQATAITVFVGPNNSGKSRALAEIARLCVRRGNDPQNVVVDDLSFVGVAEEDIDASIERINRTDPDDYLPQDEIFVGSYRGKMRTRLDNLRHVMQHPHRDVVAFCQWYLQHQILVLDATNRTGLTGMQAGGDLQKRPESNLQVLFRDDVKREEVRRIVFEALKCYFVIDPTSHGHLRIRLSERPPRDDIQEKGLHADAVAFHGSAQIIDDASDGVKAFIGIISEVIAGDPQIMLIDEPEAFLHPSLAAKLAYELSRAATSSKKNVFVSTHSAAFVMGCIQSGAPVNIIRLTYRSGVASARILPSEKLLALMRHPLLRSVGILNGLFYEFVVVTESDADRAFYQEINERLLQFQPEFGIPNCLFINAQNKQTIQTILRPLREIGIPAAAVVDIDVLKEGGVNWTNLLSAAGVPEISQAALATLRAAVKKAMDGTGRDMKRDGGVEILQGTDRRAAEDLIDQMGKYGIFVVSSGELESWLQPLNAAGHGPTWLIEVFEKMGADPADPNYLRPHAGDAWAFLGKIRAWLVDSNRKGIPS